MAASDKIALNQVIVTLVIGLHSHATAHILPSCAIRCMAAKKLRTTGVPAR